MAYLLKERQLPINIDPRDNKLDDPEERIRLGKAARARVNACHDERAAAHALAAALRTLR